MTEDEVRAWLASQNVAADTVTAPVEEARRFATRWAYTPDRAAAGRRIADAIALRRLPLG